MILLFAILVFSLLLYMWLNNPYDRNSWIVLFGFLFIVALESSSINRILFHQKHFIFSWNAIIGFILIIIAQLLIAFLITLFSFFLVGVNTRFFFKKTKQPLEYEERLVNLEHYPLVLEGRKKRYKNFLGKKVLIDQITEGEIVEIQFFSRIVKVHILELNTVIDYEGIEPFLSRIKILNN